MCTEFIIYGLLPLIIQFIVWAFILTWQQIKFIKKDIKRIREERK